MTTLRAAEKFDVNHLSSPEVAPIIDAAKVFYVEGYFLTHGLASVLTLAQKVSAAGKVRLGLVCLLSQMLIPFYQGIRTEHLCAIYCSVL